MIVEYEPSVDDFVAFNRYHIKHSPVMRRNYFGAQLVTAFLCFIIGVLLLYFSESTRSFSPALYAIPVILAIIAYFYMPRRMDASMVRNARKLFAEGENRGMKGRTRIQLTPEGIETSNGLSTSSVKWGLVEKVVASGDYIFLYLNALAALVVPGRAFKSSADREAFLKFALKYQNSTPTV